MGSNVIERHGGSTHLHSCSRSSISPASPHQHVIPATSWTEFLWCVYLMCLSPISYVSNPSGTFSKLVVDLVIKLAAVWTHYVRWSSANLVKVCGSQCVYITEFTFCSFCRKRLHHCSRSGPTSFLPLPSSCLHAFWSPHLTFSAFINLFSIHWQDSLRRTNSFAKKVYISGHRKH